MAYIGPEPKLGRNREADDISSSFNGSTTAFTLQVGGSNASPGTANDIIVSIGGVIQNPNTDYTVAGSTLTFTTAPASGLSFFAVLLGQSIDAQVTTVSDGSVTGSKLSSPLDLLDNQKIRFGNGNDLEIFHNANNSVINDAGTGDLLLQLGGSTKFQLASGGVALTGGAAANITALSDGATITIDMATACHHSVTLGGNRTFAAPSNQVVGQAGSIFITQDGTGSRTAAFNSAFKFVGGTAPTLTTTASAVDRIDYIIKSSNVIHCAVSLDVK